tara:strand:- start:25 stop:255 length:231 start_codon:yes stop_codon:yes gene_type:complete
MSTPTPRTDKMSESLLSKTFLTSYVTMQDLARTLERELATERARLDWVFHNCKVTSDDFTVHDREDLGAAMKEDAK